MTCMHSRAERVTHYTSDNSLGQFALPRCGSLCENRTSLLFNLSSGRKVEQPVLLRARCRREWAEHVLASHHASIRNM